MKYKQMWGKLEYEIEHILAPYFSYDEKMRKHGDIMYIRKLMRDIKDNNIGIKY